MALPDVEQSCREIAVATDLALLLDLDGTLIPFAPTPEAAQLDAAAVKLLDALHVAGVRVVLVSGRSRQSLQPFCARAEHAAWFAEHGAWRSLDGRIWTGPPSLPEVAELVELLARAVTVPGVRLEPKSLSVCVHVRLVPDAVRATAIAVIERVCEAWLALHPEFERLDGVETLEIRVRSVNKGEAVAWVREHLPASRVLAIGDDLTDDDMFGALGANDMSIAVGARCVRGRCRVPDPSAVRELLWWLVQLRTRRDTTPSPGLLTSSLPARGSARLVVVSNRIPPRESGRERSVGGLAAALEPALKVHTGVWLGWSGRESSGERPLAIDDHNHPVYASFDFAPGWRERFYGGLCNRALWPLFHGFPGRVHYSDVDWAAYVEANREFAGRALDLATPDGTVWVHDYHLLLVGRYLREAGFTGPLGLFLHVPFPGPDLLDTLPWARELVDGVRAFDLVGFHTRQWADNFRACASAYAPALSVPEIGVLPIGVDPLTFGLRNAELDPEISGLRAALGRRRLIIGVDRLDFAKGIPERLLAYERLLETKPEWRSAIAFVQISVPSRGEVPEYVELRQRVERLVGRINGRFGEADWVPVRYLNRSYDHRALADLYRAADVALVTPLRDGLNLVAKEFVAAQDPASPGVLVLSRFAGAAAELEQAVITNPYHVDGLAEDIDRALRMSAEERTRRHLLLYATIERQTPAEWASVFLARLRSAVHVQP